jgi:hypothetical protein
MASGPWRGLVSDVMCVSVAMCPSQGRVIKEGVGRAEAELEGGACCAHEERHASVLC